MKAVLRYLLLQCLLPLTIGGIIYLLFRKDSRQFEIVLDNLGIISENKFFVTDHLPDWIPYNLPDGLWLYSFITYLALVWKRAGRLNLIFIFFVPTLFAISIEFFQYAGLVKGTFDILDVITYLLVFIFSSFQFSFWKK